MAVREQGGRGVVGLRVRCDGWSWSWAGCRGSGAAIAACRGGQRIGGYVCSNRVHAVAQRAAAWRVSVGCLSGPGVL
jgi:hypothetical protein